MPLPAVLAILVTAQTALLMVPWIAVKVTFYSPPNPLTNPEHADTARSARWKIDIPLSLGLMVLAGFWIDHPYSAVLTIYLALITRLLVYSGNLARRSIPVLGLAFPWCVAPVLAWGAVLVVASLTEGGLGWLWWLVAAVLAVLVPPQLQDLVATLLRAVLVNVKRLWLRRRLRGRWVSSAGGWIVCDVRAGEGDVGSPEGTAVLLAYASWPARFGWVTGQPPRFLVEVMYDTEWQPGPDQPYVDLADHAGPGPIRTAMVAGGLDGIRVARARLDEQLVVVVDELRIGGDDFYQFITSLTPTGGPT